MVPASCVGVGRVSEYNAEDAAPATQLYPAGRSIGAMSGTRTTRATQKGRLPARLVVLFLAAIVGILRPTQDGGRLSGEVVPGRSDTLIEMARRALSQGRPWRASELLSAIMANDTLRTPEVALLAARAADAWGGASEVQRVLSRETWLDSLFEGEGRFLLARAQLARGDDTLAAESARLSLLAPLADADRSHRLVVLARASASLNDAASASAAYRDAAAFSPMASEWLLLRAAEWTADSALRAGTMNAIRLPHLVARGAQIDAVAAENTGDTLLAIERYARLGNPAASLRLRAAQLAVSGDSIALRAELLAAIRGATSSGQARTFVDLFDASFAQAEPTEDVAIARALGSAGGERTAASYARAFAVGLGNDADHFVNGGIMVRLGRTSDAVREFGSVSAPPALAAAAAYQRGRAMFRGDEQSEWREALRTVVREHPSDTSAGTALYLLADVASDEGREEAARDAFLASAKRYPSNSRAPSALFSAAMIAYVQGSLDSAAAEFESLRTVYPDSPDAIAAAFWKGRTLERAGRAGAMAEACAAVYSADSLSYYAYRCAARQLTRPWVPLAAPDTFAQRPDVDSIVVRVIALRRLGLSQEADLELDRIRAIAGSDPEQILSGASSLRELGAGSRAVALAQLAQSRGGRRDARLYRLLFPETYMDIVAVEASQYALDRNMLAGLIRQESLFNPAATSPAGARGLMQLMPAVGAGLARSFGFRLWDPVLLWQPDVNARLGVRHYADLVMSQQHLFHVLASYNAGESRVTRWLTKGGTEDPEVFVERIPFVETRNYVRIVARNSEIYRALYAR
jgi:soluble lytic murein transglycosylase